MVSRPPQFLADLVTAEGHIQKAITMLEAGSSRIKILHQIINAKTALSEVNAKITSKHFQKCTRSILESKNPEERLATVQNLVDLYDSVVK